MQTTTPYLNGLRRLITARDRRIALLGVWLVTVTAGLVTGALFGGLGPLLALSTLAALVVLMLVLRSTMWGVMGLILLICVLPYAAMPVYIGFTPTFIDAAFAGIFVVWAFRVASKTDTRLELSPLGAPLIIFMVWATVTFVAGLSHSPLSANVLRHFAEVMLAISLFFVLVNTVRREEDLAHITKALLLGGGAAAGLGLLFYSMPEELSIRILSMLRVFNYPAGAEVLRYIEDNPDLPMRAIGTSIDPNALGGLLVVLTILSLVQLSARKPLLPRPLVALGSVAMLAALYLTYSRGSLLAVAFAVLLLGLMRYRRLLLVMALAVVLFLVLPQTDAYVDRLVEGFYGADRSTQMRFGEYRDALTLITRYPLMGVGFSGTPDIDLYLGVSNLYLLVASQMGLIGLALYLLVAATYLWFTFSRWRQLERGGRLESMLLGYQLGVVGALASGVFDHFFFNISFVHLIGLYWLTMGLGVSAAMLASKDQRAAEVGVKHV